MGQQVERLKRFFGAYRLNGRQTLLCLTCLLALPALGCGIIGFVENPAPLTGPSYWAAETATAIPTVTVFLGTTTPVYPATPVPNQVTTVPEWTTVTATPIFQPPTWTPFGFTATPFWVTTTPNIITETPVPPWTTTPGLPQIGYTTAVPSETPYYRIGTFYMNSDVYVGGPDGLVFRITSHQTQSSPNDDGAVYHYLTIRVTNYTAEETIVPVSDVFFIRQVERDGALLRGRWVPQNEPLLAAGLPDYETQQLVPISPDGQREIILGFVLPEGAAKEAGLITQWERPIEGGLPVWFYLENDPLGPLIDAYKPPPPTPILLDDGGSSGGGQPGGGSGIWPTTGTISRGFGCHEFYTGVNGAGYGCPPDKPWFHNGVDIANVQGTAVWSPVDGQMLYAGPNSTGADCSAIPGSQPPYEGLGNYQRLNGPGPDGASSSHYFGHLSAFLVTSGPVTTGQNTAEMGSSGCSTGPHLHWMVYENGSLIDPALWAGPGPSP